MKELITNNPGRFWEVGQFSNEDNSKTHYESTGPEIWEQAQGRIDIFVAAVGSGGTLTGAGRYLKERNPKLRVFAVEPRNALFSPKGDGGLTRLKVSGMDLSPGYSM